jgi:hypothetical protein
MPIRSVFSAIRSAASMRPRIGVTVGTPAALATSTRASVDRWTTNSTPRTRRAVGMTIHGTAASPNPSNRCSAGDHPLSRAPRPARRTAAIRCCVSDTADPGCR